MLARDARGRAQATDVRYAGRARHAGDDRTVAVLVAAAFFAALAGAVSLDRLPALALAADGVLSLLALLLYRADKQAAQSGAWRTPETTLLAVGLLGGWPGALVARAVFRHKTRKQPFVTLFWLAVAVHCAVLVWASMTEFPR